MRDCAKVVEKSMPVSSSSSNNSRRTTSPKVEEGKSEMPHELCEQRPLAACVLVCREALLSHAPRCFGRNFSAAAAATVFILSIDLRLR